MGTRSSDLPLITDLDGTVIRTDLLWEGLLVLLRKRPQDLLLLPIWLWRGRAYLKARIAERITLDISVLPYNSAVLDQLQRAHQEGRRVILASGSPLEWSKGVAAHLNNVWNSTIVSQNALDTEKQGVLAARQSLDLPVEQPRPDQRPLIEAVLGSDEMRNLVGAAKLDEIRRVYGNGPFDYLGDSQADLPLWRTANSALIVGSAPFVRKISASIDGGDNGGTSSIADKTSTASPAAKGVHREIVHLSADDHSQTRISNLRAVFAVLRPHQWSKNLLLFVPLILAHEFYSVHKWLELVIAFAAMSLCASSTYVFNDLLDIEADRHHATKRHRAFASGILSIPFGLAIGIACLLAGLLIGIVALPLGFARTLILYCLLTLSYSFKFKRYILLDVIILASLYAMRIIMGGQAAMVEVSDWLSAFSIFFFLSLAFAKRHAEFCNLKNPISQITESRLIHSAGPRSVEDESRDFPHELGGLNGRGYVCADELTVLICGLCSGFLSVLVFYLYLFNSEQVLVLYRNQPVLYLVGIVLLYWIMRIWFLAQRGELHEDPIVFALQDRATWLAGLLTIIILTAAI